MTIHSFGGGFLFKCSYVRYFFKIISEAKQDKKTFGKIKAFSKNAHTKTILQRGAAGGDEGRL